MVIVATMKLISATATGAPRSARSLAFTAPWMGSPAPAMRPSVTQAMPVTVEAFSALAANEVPARGLRRLDRDRHTTGRRRRRRTSRGALPDDQRDAEEHGQHARAIALLDEHERQLQEQLLFGPAPLGPGAPPAARLATFYAAMIDLLDRHLHLALGAETGRSRLATGAYRFWRTHVRELVHESGVGDPETLSDVLLAPLAPEVYRLQRDDLGLTRSQITDTLGLLAERVLGRN
jgi:hypothetical protein